MKKSLLLLICPVLLISCSPGKIFEQYVDMPNNNWSNDNVVKFDVNIEDTSTPYDIDLAIRHTSYYLYANLMVNITVSYPSGEVRTKDQDLFLRTKDGKFKAEGAGDLWDISFPVYKEINFTEKGTYTIKVQNIMPHPVTEDIMQVGLIVKKSKK
jgi:gliding motility-associated lipoprotein GldH